MVPFWTTSSITWKLGIIKGSVAQFDQVHDACTLFDFVIQIVLSVLVQGEWMHPSKKSCQPSRNSWSSLMSLFLVWAVCGQKVQYRQTVHLAPFPGHPLVTYRFHFQKRLIIYQINGHCSDWNRPALKGVERSVIHFVFVAIFVKATGVKIRITKCKTNP